MEAFWKIVWGVIYQMASFYFAAAQTEKTNEANRETQTALAQAQRIANRADDAGSLSQHFAKRSSSNENIH